MNNKRVYGEETLTRVQRAWKDYKRQHAATQKDAAKVLQISTSAFGQYLRGEIPLNTDFLLRFAALVEDDPANIHPQLGGLSKPGLTKTYLPVTGTLSGREPSHGRALVAGIISENNNAEFCVEVDVAGTGYPKGTLLLVDPSDPPCDRDMVVVEGETGYRYGQLGYNELVDEWYVEMLVVQGVERFVLSAGQVPARVIGTQLPKQSKRRAFAA
ncbi:hypothetical protein HNR62_000353 [Oceanisphaera litoralis]|uniref:helix-turn-helix domain-containing protein n=1 Tax=Oceanisphaera litoralis TaxID=225144 RepID=UPI0019586383|nr:helix-turn-helix transcriptional regulator [Oceanisphaera litoralis]MBM7454524.1 hypothetical protein [Oceanisphaera litoralis]